MNFLKNTGRACADFLRKEDGVGTVYGLLTVASLVALGGVAVDVTNVVTSRTNLQLTADTVAHAALLTRERKSANDAKIVALAMAAANLPVASVGQVVSATDIVFGTWNATTNTFTPDASSRTAVQVTAREHSDTGNPVATLMLKIVGFKKWDVKVASTFSTYKPTCLREGFVAEGVVDLQSNNRYTNGFCIHSNKYVSLNSNNYFEPGTVVSMSDLDNLQLPNSGYKSNIGLAAALREGSWNIRVLSRIMDIINGIKDPASVFRPKYLVNGAPIKTLTNRTVQQADLIAGNVYTYSCSGGASLTIDSNVVVNKVAIITDCKVKFNAGVILTDSVIATSSTSDMSMTSASGLQVGKNDNCALGGEAQLVTMGSMNFPADLKVFGSQLIAAKDISFSANANGVQGAAMVAGGVISGTSNMNMGFCGNQETSNFQVDYFTLVE